MQSAISQNACPPPAVTISPTPCWFLLLQTPPGWPVTQTLELSKRRKAGFPSMAAMAEETALPWMVVSSMMIPAESARTSARSEEHTSELQSHLNLVCRLLLEKKKKVTSRKACDQPACTAWSECSCSSCR